MTTHAENVLGGILATDNPRRDLLALAAVQVRPEHFVAEVNRNIFTLLIKYYDRTGEVMPYNVFKKALEDRQVEVSKSLAYLQAYENLAKQPVSEPEFRWSIGELREEQAKRLTGVAIAESMEILERGMDIPREGFVKGHKAARDFFSKKIHDIERLSNEETAPEGDVLQEGKAILEDYVARRDSGVSQGIGLGLKSFYDATGGMQRGELILACAYTNQGKSQLVTQAAWSAAFEQGKNVFFATSETVRAQVIRRLIARHSKLPQFDTPGINSADLKRGRLSPADEKVLTEILDDWNNNPDYGKLDVVQVPNGAKLSYIEHRLKEFGRENECGLVVIDYLALLKSETKRGTEREEFNEILRDAKMMAVAFNDGQGVPILSPWQMNRDKFTEAQRNRYYTLASLADTSEAEKSSDLILALLRDEEDMTTMRFQVLKARDDMIPPITDVDIDFRYTYIADRREATSLTAAAQAAGGVDADLMSFIS